MDFLIVLGALCFLMFVAYRGYSVILFAPVAALGAVLLTDPQLVAPMFTGLFMDKMVGFLKLYFPVFLLGALFGKVIELSGFSKSIVAATIRMVGAQRAMLSIVIVCALLTYGGVSLFVVVFAVYPFAAELFRQSDIPKRLIPGTIALGAFTFTMDALPGTPQIQNIIPTTFFGTNTWAAPWLGTLGGIFILVLGMAYLDWRRRVALKAGERYGDPATLLNEPTPFTESKLAHPLIAILPLLVVGVVNKLLTMWIPGLYGDSHSFVPAVIGNAAPVVQDVAKISAIWAVLGALLAGILCVLLFAWKPVSRQFAEGSKSAIGGSLLAGMNTASEYGFGGVIASLPGFLVIAGALQAIPDALAADLRAHGGELVCGEEVTTPPSGVVLYDIAPTALLRIYGDRLPARYAKTLRRYRYGPGVAKVDFVLSDEIPWRDARLAQAPTLHLGGDRKTMAFAEDEIDLRGGPGVAPGVIALLRQGLEQDPTFGEG